MRDAAKLLAENLVFADLGRLQPHVGFETRDQVHLDPELGDREVVQHVLGAQPEPHRSAHRDMDDRLVDEDVVAAVGVVGIDAEGIVAADQAVVDDAEFAVPSGKAEIPVPLLADGLHFERIVGHLHELGPDEQAGCQHRGDADRGQHGQPDLQLLVFGLVVGFCTGLVSIADDRVSHEQVDGDKHDTRHDQRDVDRGVDHPPVGGDRRKRPGTEEMEQKGTQYEHNQYNC